MRKTRIFLSALGLTAGQLLSPALARAQTGLPPLRRTSEEWESAFALLRESDAEFQVASVDEFKRITAYYADLATDGIAEHAFHTRTGESIRCVSLATQRSFRDSAPAGTAPLLAPLEPPPDDRPSVESGVADHGSPFGLDGSPDEDGNVRSCPLLTFPQLVPRLHDLYRFRTLDSVFAKYPERMTPFAGNASRSPLSAGIDPPATAPTGHEYAHAYAFVQNIGTHASFNLWSPAVQQTDEFSLAQLWVTRGIYDDNSLQSFETGWQVYPQLYGDAKAHLFIYSTSRAYTPGSGCYNLMCSRFVQTDNSVVIAGSFTTYSTVGGQQYELPLTAYRDPGTNDWWLRFGNTWVGYYPSSLFGAAGLLNYADEIDYGGEIVNDDINGVHTTTDMGSGRFAEEGYTRAAYVNDITYWTPGGAAYYPGALNPVMTNPDAYDLKVSYDDPSWHTYFLFGGPGGTATTTKVPNLALYEPQGWESALVVSKVDGSAVQADTIFSSDQLFLNWAVQNNGTAATAAPFSVNLYLDGVLMSAWSANETDALPSGYYLFASDIPIGSLSAGNHVVRLLADATHAIAESNENDNEKISFLTVQSPPAPPCDPGVNPRCGVRVVVPRPRPPRG